MNKLFDTYKKEILPKIQKEFGITNPMAAPRLTKIVVNASMGEALTDKKVLEKMGEQLAVITGQKAQITRAKRAISSFKLRAGDAIGLRVTLRGQRMYDFLTKLVGIALPRVRDFHGVPSGGFDGRGNYTLGISDQNIFPELDYSMIDKTRGFQITFVTKTTNNEQGKMLLTLLGIPFEKEG